MSMEFLNDPLGAFAAWRSLEDNKKGYKYTEHLKISYQNRLMCKRQREIHISWMKHLSAMNTSAMLSTEAWKTLITRAQWDETCSFDLFAFF